MNATALITRQWKKGQLQDLVFFQRGFDITQAQQSPGPFPVISSSGITSYHSEFKANGPGVVIGRKGTLGLVHFSEGNYWPHDTTLWSKDLRGNNARFIYFYLKTIDLKRFDVGNSNPTLNRNHIHDLEVFIPPLAIQERIVDKLLPYEDLIENNLRRMALLEESARLLYQEWFIYLRYPSHENVTRKWGIKELGGIVDVKKGKNITKDTVIEGEVPVVAGGLEPAYYHNVSNVSAPVITISASGANAGYVNLYHENIWASDCSFIDANTTPYVYYYFLLLRSKQREITGLQKGAAQPHVYPKDIMGLMVNVPDNRILNLFTDEVMPVFGQIKNLSLQNQKLKDARDIMLPRLMNGEIPV